MPYQSPLHILDSLQISPDDLNSEGIGRLRKKLLAEFSLNTDITIKVSGNDYTKDAILKVIDQLKETDNLALHKEIFSRKPLLNWLENPVKGNFPYELASQVLDITDSHWYQNILQEALLLAVKFHFRKRQFATTTNLLQFLTNLSDIYGYVVYDLMHDEIHTIIELIETAQKSPNVRQDRESFGFITEPEWTDFLNNLPNYFEETRENYCYAAVNYTVAVQKKDRNWTYEISSQLDQTLCGEHIKKTISSNHEIYTNNFQGKSTSERSGWSWLWIIVVIVANLAKMKSCNSDYSSRTTTYESPKYEEIPSYTEPIPVEMDTSKIGNSSPTVFSSQIFYQLEVKHYKKNLLNENWKNGGQKNTVLTGEDPFGNADIGNLEEEAKTKYQLVEFKNGTDFDLVIMKIGSVPNRSYYLRSHDVTFIKCSLNDKLCFYFGKEWLKRNQISTDTERFQAYFFTTHKNTINILSKFYTIFTGSNHKLSVIGFDNETLENNLPPKTNDIVLVRTDSTGISQ